MIGRKSPTKWQKYKPKTWLKHNVNKFIQKKNQQNMSQKEVRKNGDLKRSEDDADMER